MQVERLLAFAFGEPTYVLVALVLLMSNLVLIIHQVLHLGRRFGRWRRRDYDWQAYDDFKALPLKYQYKYYEYMRNEVVREDDLTHQRLTWMITFQGFMISAVAVLIGFAWPPEDTLESVVSIRKISLAAIPIVGLAFGHIAFLGIIASRRSLGAVRHQWEQRNQAWHLYPGRVPQAYGHRGPFQLGAAYAVWISLMFIWMWQVYFAVYLIGERSEFWDETLGGWLATLFGMAGQ